ncbi:hypothetical protein H6G17_09060 [Chroococcidiopsis sp. FACHB-1243]|nr:hypothetical protein [Chroococcidiopsis sp. [FACHB-1243]]MBD2305665.1 hypothetical protein [Chroococcidiopsis sp. [FACHB-1243]]
MKFSSFYVAASAQPYTYGDIAASIANIRCWEYLTRHLSPAIIQPYG